MGYPECVGILKLKGYLNDCRTVGSGAFSDQVSSSLLAVYYFSFLIKEDFLFF